VIIAPQKLKAGARDELRGHIGLPWNVPTQNLQENTTQCQWRNSNHINNQHNKMHDN